MTDAFLDASDPDRALLVHGRRTPLPERLAVRAGPLALVIEAGDVRHVHVGGREVVRRIYGAVRDHLWRTIPGRITGFALERRGEAFTCRYRAEHRGHDVAFSWDAAIEGRADGTLTFAFDGVAETTFERNRIGLCLLHPLPGLSGARVRVTTTGGQTRALRVPDLVTLEQPIDGFDDIAALACEIGPDLWLEATVEGDVFQAEDQRNWIDASTKVYSTPLGLPRPVRVPAGTRVTQRITLRLRTDAGEAAEVAAAPFVIDADRGEVRFGDGAPGRVPAIGVRSRAALRHLPAAHLRVDLDLSDAGLTDAGPSDAGIASTGATSLPRTAGPPIELALRLPADGGAAAHALSRVDLGGIDVARVLAFTADHDTTQPATLDAVRAWLHGLGRAATPMATGTASDLARIHLAPDPLVPGDAICWAMDPQAHATDLTTIAETPDGARDQVRTVRHRHPGVPVAVAASFGRQGRPDPRTGSLFAAGWTLALVGALAEAGADSVTLLDDWAEDDRAAAPDRAAGDERDRDDDLAARPVIRVLAALTPYAGARVRPMASSLYTVRALWLEAGDRDVLFVANLAPRGCEVALPAGHGPWQARILDAGTAFADDLGLVGMGSAQSPDPGGTVGDRLALGPCAIARLEAPRR